MCEVNIGNLGENKVLSNAIILQRNIILKKKKFIDRVENW